MDDAFEKELRKAFVVRGALGMAAVARREHERVVLLEKELAKASEEVSDPEWDRIQKLSDDEVKAELIADGVYKDEAEIAEQSKRFTLRVHEMLRMKCAGERIERERWVMRVSEGLTQHIRLDT